LDTLVNVRVDAVNFRSSQYTSTFQYLANHGAKHAVLLPCSCATFKFIWRYLSCKLYFSYMVIFLLETETKL